MPAKVSPQARRDRDVADAVRLPVLSLLAESLRDVLGNLAGLGRAVWPWVVFGVAAAGVGHALLPPLPAGELPSSAEDVPAWLIAVLGGIVLLLGMIALSVVWQRHVILGEPLSGAAPLSRLAWRYLLSSATVYLAAALPFAGCVVVFAVLDAAAGPSGETSEGTALFATVAGTLAGVLVLVGLSLAPVAVSVGDRSVTLRQSWSLARADHGRLVAAFLLLTILLWTPPAVLSLIAGAVGWPATHPARGTGATPGALSVTAALAATALVWAYNLFGTAVGRQPHSEGVPSLGQGCEAPS